MGNKAKTVRARAYKAITTGVLMMGAAAALAQQQSQARGISSWFANIGMEVTSIVDWLVVIFGAIGIACAGGGLISAMFAKKNREPLGWQPWFIGGGAIAIVFIPFILAMGTSVSGEEQSKEDVSQFLESQ